MQTLENMLLSGANQDFLIEKERLEQEKHAIINSINELQAALDTNLNQQVELVRNSFGYCCRVEVYDELVSNSSEEIYVHYVDTYHYDVDMMSTYLIASNSKEAISNLLALEEITDPTWLT